MFDTVRGSDWLGDQDAIADMCRELPAWYLEDGSLHRFRANMTVIAGSGCGRIYQSCTSDHTCCDFFTIMSFFVLIVS